MVCPAARRIWSKTRWLVGLALLCSTSLVLADRATESEQPAGLAENPPNVHALVNARIIPAPGKVIVSGTIVIRAGVIEAVGADVKPPPDARVWDCQGKTVYPGFVEAYSEVADGSSAGKSSEEMLRPAPAGAAYWNGRVTPQVRAADGYKVDPALNKQFRSQGFVARLVAPSRQVVKGSSAAVTTGDTGAAEGVLRPTVAMHVRLTPPSRRESTYPDSPMGAYALVRQAIYDARWYADARKAWESDPALPRPEQNDALEALGPASAGKMPLYVDAPDELYALRADRLGKEFELPVVIRGSGQEYRRLGLIAEGHRPIVVPVNFDKPPDVASPDLALNVSLDELMDWDLQPENAAKLDNGGVKIALTSFGLKEKSGFLAAVRKAVQRGLSKEAALRALAQTPAEILGLERSHGSIEKGKSASLVVADGDIFADKSQVLETWVDGVRYEVSPALSPDPRGGWILARSSGDEAAPSDPILKVQISGTAAKLAGTFSTTPGEAQLPTTGPASRPATRPADAELSGVAYVPGVLSFTYKSTAADSKGFVRASLTITGEQATGRLVFPDGKSIDVEGKRVSKPQAKDKDPVETRQGGGDDGKSTSTAKKDDPTTRPASFAVNFPMGAFGRSSPPQQPVRVLFRDATVWTCGDKGTLPHASVLIERGKIVGVYSQNEVPNIEANTVIIDCQGKHLSPGIIDCHSHIATDGGVNESGRAVTCNVRISDFIDPDDINIYRQMAGGVTSSNILHGSANPIGGQTQVIKMRWGAGPEQMKFEGAKPGVKFALGENVKQANSERETARYPQTRLGVEQIVRERFIAARQYHAEVEAFEQGGRRGIPPRTDLELQALWEILSGARIIHCHSYRQDEVLALLRTCESFGVHIATLQHILEGYKVADDIRRHGAGASSFSDWWAYKFEVYDAIPYNGAVLHNAGVVVSFNSDDAELARRLNLEAAKAVKYGGVPPEEALKFVTLNPARQLRIDDKVGSIEPGKDADLVVWSASPLSNLGRCEQTWIDGRRYFDLDEDRSARERDQERRDQLIQKALQSGSTPADPKGTRQRERDKWAREDLFCGFHSDDDSDGRDR